MRLAGTCLSVRADSQSSDRPPRQQRQVTLVVSVKVGGFEDAIGNQFSIAVFRKFIVEWNVGLCGHNHKKLRSATGLPRPPAGNFGRDDVQVVEDRFGQRNQLFSILRVHGLTGFWVCH